MDEKNPPNLTARRVETPNSSYQIIPIVTTPKINPGNQFIASIYLAGYGTVLRNKFAVVWDHESIINHDNPGKVVYGLAGRIDKESNSIRRLVTGKSITEAESAISSVPIRTTGVSIGIPDSFFVDSPTNKTGPGSEFYQKGFFPFITSEYKYGQRPPIQLVINTSSTAPPGDYRMCLCFTYYDGKEVQQSTEWINLHINSKREELEPWPTWAGIIAVLIALLSLLHQSGVIGWFLQFFP